MLAALAFLAAFGAVVTRLVVTARRRSSLGTEGA
jgi:hypothetical protein